MDASAEELLSTAAMRTAAEGEIGRWWSELREEQRLRVAKTFVFMMILIFNW